MKHEVVASTWDECVNCSCFAFQFYGYLSQQQNMMQDYIRTSTYQRAMLDNSSDFMDKVDLTVNYIIGHI